MDIRWALTDGRDVYDGFDGYLDLNGQTAEIRKAIRSEINEAIRARAGADGVARIPNPATLVAGAKPLAS